jgi:predicted kinase
VGPIECGKSTFTEKILRPQLQFEDHDKGFKTNVQVISVDQICKQLLGHDYDKYDQVRLEASFQVFEMLMHHLDLVTSFPINAEFVIIDSMGLSTDFREMVCDIARANQYRIEVIVFDYKDHNDYFASEHSHRLISNQISCLQKEVMPMLAEEKYNGIHKINKKDFLENPNYQVNIKNKEEFLATLLLQNQMYGIIGDVHECVDELQRLIQKLGFDIQDSLVIPTEKSQNKKLIFVGDWIDKGRQTGKIVDFMYRNKEHFLLTLGNHENFVYKYLRDEISGANQETVDNYFTSIAYFQKMMRPVQNLIIWLRFHSHSLGIKD